MIRCLQHGVEMVVILDFRVFDTSLQDVYLFPDGFHGIFLPTYINQKPVQALEIEKRPLDGQLLSTQEVMERGRDRAANLIKGSSDVLIETILEGNELFAD